MGQNENILRLSQIVRVLVYKKDCIDIVSLATVGLGWDGLRHQVLVLHYSISPVVPFKNSVDFFPLMFYFVTK